MSLAPKIVTRASGTTRPRGKHGFARVVVVLAWVTFWLNAAFSPCCEAIAASIDGQSAAQVVSSAQPAHDSDETNTHHPDHSHNSPCDFVVSAGPAIMGHALILPAEQLEFVSITPGAVISLSPAVVCAFSLTAYPTPPPKVPPYLRDLRIRL